MQRAEDDTQPFTNSDEARVEQDLSSSMYAYRHSILLACLCSFDKEHSLGSKYPNPSHAREDIQVISILSFVICYYALNFFCNLEHKNMISGDVLIDYMLRLSAEY